MNGAGLPSVLVALGAAGVTLRVSGSGRLQYRPVDLAAPLGEGITAHYQALLSILGGYQPAGAEACYVLEERLGVAEGLGLSVQPGAPAWLVAVGEALQAEGRGCPVAMPLAEPEPVDLAAPALDVTPQRLAAWDAAAAGGRRRRRRGRGTAGVAVDARRFMAEAWRRVARLERCGVPRPDAIGAVLTAMAATPADGGAGGGCVTVTGMESGRAA